jgi:hypothetical protein
MVEIGGMAALEAGAHQVRVEFFEAGGGAGLIVSFQVPGVPKQPIPAEHWSHQAPCSSDTNADGVVDVQDLVNVVLDWGTDGSVHGGDVDENGTVDVQDLATVILDWGPCR